MIEPKLYELHDRARERGIEGYRRMAKSELMEALGEAEPAGPTTVESLARGGLGLLTLRGGPDRPRASVRLAGRGQGSQAAVQPQRARLRAPVGGGRAHRRARAPAGRPAPVRDVRADLLAGGAHPGARRRGGGAAQAALP